MSFKFFTPNSKVNLIVFAVAVLLFSFCSKKTETSSVESDDSPMKSKVDYQISLAQWSLHKTYFGGPIEDWGEFGRLMAESPDSVLKGDIDPMNFPQVAASYGIKTIELVNYFYFTKANDKAYWEEFKKNCEIAGVSVGLIMCDRLGNIGDEDDTKRQIAIENHFPWVDIAAYLGAKSVRVNAAGAGTPEEVAANAIKGLSTLGVYGATKGINIIVENHGGYSSNGKWLANVMKSVAMDNVGTLPDFGNFCIERSADGCANEYDKYQGMKEIMPYAKGVSAKSHDFNESGDETKIDYYKMMEIIRGSGFQGDIGIEFEGNELSEDEGIRATKTLIEKVIK